MAHFGEFRRRLALQYVNQQRDMRRTLRRLEKYKGESPPEDYLDPITELLMTNPVYAPDLGGVFEHRTISIVEKEMLEERSRLPPKAIPCRPLQDEITKWLDEARESLAPIVESRTAERRAARAARQPPGGGRRQSHAYGGGGTAYSSDEESLPLSQKSPTSDIDSDMEADLKDVFAEDLCESLLGSYIDEGDCEVYRGIRAAAKQLRERWAPVLARLAEGRERERQRVLEEERRQAAVARQLQAAEDSRAAAQECTAKAAAQPEVVVPQPPPPDRAPVGNDSQDNNTPAFLQDDDDTEVGSLYSSDSSSTQQSQGAPKGKRVSLAPSPAVPAPPPPRQKRSARRPKAKRSGKRRARKEESDDDSEEESDDEYDPGSYDAGSGGMGSLASTSSAPSVASSRSSTSGSSSSGSYRAANRRRRRVKEKEKKLPAIRRAPAPARHNRDPPKRAPVKLPALSAKRAATTVAVGSSIPQAAPHREPPRPVKRASHLALDPRPARPSDAGRMRVAEADVPQVLRVKEGGGGGKVRRKRGRGGKKQPPPPPPQALSHPRGESSGSEGDGFLFDAEDEDGTALTPAPLLPRPPPPRVVYDSIPDGAILHLHHVEHALKCRRKSHIHGVLAFERHKARIASNRRAAAELLEGAGFGWKSTCVGGSRDAPRVDEGDGEGELRPQVLLQQAAEVSC